MLRLELLSFSLLFASLAQADLLTCLNGIGAPITTSSSPNWATTLLTSNFNARYTVLPAAIIQPKNTAQIAQAFTCGQQNGVKVSPLGGGHSFTAYGLGGVDGALVVDMSLFKDIKLTKNKKQVAVGGGVVVGELATFLGKYELYFPHARGSYVGVAGSAIGGGFGTTTRISGTTLDTVEGVDMILPNGTVVHSTATQNPEILFASLGAAYSYGIITTLYMRTYSFHQFPKVITYTYSMPPINAQQAVDQYLAFQDFGLHGSPPQLSLRYLPRFAGANSQISGVYYGDMASFTATMAPLLAKLPTPANTTINTLTFLEAEAAISGSLNTTAPFTFQDNFYTQSTMPRKAYNNATLLAFFTKLESQWAAHPRLTVWTYTDIWGGVGSYSQTHAHKKPDAAFEHTDAQFLFRLDGRVKGESKAWPEDGFTFLEALVAPLYEAEQAQEGGVRSYLNYRDSQYNTTEWSTRYYGSNFNRLKQLKAAVDPLQLMSAVPQSIPLP